jgi:hypothetical protein
MYGRSEWRGRVSDSVRLIGGLDVVYWPGQYTYEGPSATQAEGSPENNAAGSAFSNRDRVTVRDDFTIVQPAIYFETEVSLPPVRVVLGSRIDYYDEIQEYSYDPRGSAQLSVTDTTTLKGGIGLYTQPPQYYEASPGLGNPDLEPMPSLHVSTGVEQKLGEGYSIGVEGFYKHLYDNVVGTQFGEAPFFTNEGEGRIYGLELLAKIEPRGRFFGYLSYTLSRSERNDRDEGWRLFDFDQPHIVTAAGVYRLGRGWELGALFRLVSGNTDTPVTGSSLNTVTGQYSPLFGRTNSIRNPAFHRLDLRIEKQWTLDWSKIALYLDVQNVYNAENSEGAVYDYEYRKKETIIGLPIIPILGVRGEI